MKQFVRKNLTVLLMIGLVLLCGVPTRAEDMPKDTDTTSDEDTVVTAVQPDETKTLKAEPAVQSNDSIVSIPDVELKSRLLAEGFDENGDGELSVTEMKKITNLDLRINKYGTNITDLTGLETAVNVETFLINIAEIQDFSVLSLMPNLNTVGINNSEINTSSLMASLRSCSNLETLYFNMMGIDFADLSGLSALTQIKSLNLYATRVSDISEVSNLVNLQSLILDSTNVDDLSPLISCKNLKELSILSTAVTDLTPLAACANLESLNLGWDLNNTSGITDVSALASCKNLKELYVVGDTAITAEMIFNALTPDEQTCNLTLGCSDIVMFNNCKVSIFIEGSLEQYFEAKHMTWASENPDIVEVTEDFKFNAKQVGKSRVTATFGKISKIFNITVTDPEQPIVVDPSTENINTAIANIKKNGTVVVKGSGIEEQQTLPKNFMQTVKEKELTVIVPDARNNSELVIQGASLGTIQGNLKLSVYRDEAVNETLMVNNRRDNIYYPVTVVTSDTTIPVTIRIKLDDDFRKKCGNNPVRLSRETADGSIALIQDKLKISEDGYIEAVFGNGLSGGAASQMLYADGSRAESRSSNSETIEFIVSSRTETGGEFILGDISGNGDITMADLMMCLHHVSGRTLLSGTQFTAADINGDGQITMADLMKLLHYVSGRNKELN